MHGLPHNVRFQFAAVATALLLVAGCGTDTVAEAESEETATEDSGESTAATETSAAPATSAPEPADEPVAEAAELDLGFDADELQGVLMRDYATASTGIWPGFDPNEHPTIVMWASAEGETIGLMTMNFPNPELLGVATDMSPSEGILTAHQIQDVDDDVSALLALVGDFELFLEVAGVDAYIVRADPPGQGSLFDPTNGPEFSSTLLHEMFHRYQVFAFTDGEGQQDTGGYAYTAQNLELALLEDRALVAALTATDGAEREIATRHLAGIRLHRLDVEPRVVLDEDQEILEGVPRYLESRIAGTDSSYTFNESNFAEKIVTDSGAILGPIKFHFGFDRFYSSGAGQLQLIRLLGITGIEERIEAGESPMDILISEFGLTLEDAPELLADARTAYDADGSLAVSAAEAATEAEAETDPLSEGAIEQYLTDEPFIEVMRDVFGDESIDCLLEAGVDFESDEPPADAILDECGVDLDSIG